MPQLKAPFPYFGGKSSIADLVWDRFGEVRSYIEPFVGSAAISLANPRPEALELEILNDLDGMITNAWRTLKWNPEELKPIIDWPMNELDLHARSEWVESQRGELEARLHGEDLTDILRTDPHFHDVKIAAWWIWGMGAAIGDAFVKQKKAIPCVYSPRGVHGKTFDVDAMLAKFETRLRNTRVTCGNWKRVVGDNILLNTTPVAVFLDPPYANKDRHDTYAHESYSVASEVGEWCLEHGDNPDVKIILAGYEGDYELPESWECIPWKTMGGYGNISRVEGGTTRGKENACKERLWLNPSCNASYDSSIFSSFI